MVKLFFFTAFIFIHLVTNASSPTSDEQKFVSDLEKINVEGINVSNVKEYFLRLNKFPAIHKLKKKYQNLTWRKKWSWFGIDPEKEQVLKEALGHNGIVDIIGPYAITNADWTSDYIKYYGAEEVIRLLNSFDTEDDPLKAAREANAPLKKYAETVYATAVLYKYAVRKTNPAYQPSSDPKNLVCKIFGSHRDKMTERQNTIYIDWQESTLSIFGAIMELEKDTAVPTTVDKSELIWYALPIELGSSRTEGCVMNIPSNQVTIYRSKMTSENNVPAVRLALPVPGLDYLTYNDLTSFDGINWTRVWGKIGAKDSVLVSFYRMPTKHLYKFSVATNFTCESVPLNDTKYPGLRPLTAHELSLDIVPTPAQLQ